MKLLFHTHGGRGGPRFPLNGAINRKMMDKA